MPFRIPKEDIPAIKTLRAMPSASMEIFVKSLKALKGTSLSADTDEVARGIAEQVPSVPSKELEAVLDTLHALAYIREFSGVNHKTFLDDFVEGLQNEPELAVDSREAHKLKTTFEKLLNIDRFTLSSKAKRLQRDGERLYCDAKIISDIRPVFGAKPTARPIGAVVTHTLKLGYHEAGDHKEFHVILDSVDLGLLAELIYRAHQKDDTLRAMLKEMHLLDLSV